QHRLPGSHTTDTEITNPTVGKPGRYFSRRPAKPSSLPCRNRTGLAWGGRGTTRTFPPVVPVLLTLTGTWGTQMAEPTADLLVRNAKLVAACDADGRELAGGWVAITG